MKRLLFLLVGFCLAFSALLSFTSDLFGKANARTTKQARTMSTVASNSPAKTNDWQLGQPITYENLTIFPVVSNAKASSEEFITLDEGLRTKTVKVKEIGGTSTRTVRPSRSAHHSNQVQQQRLINTGDNAEVNRVMVTNNSGKTLVLIAGEIIVGGKQDRIVGQDCIVASTNKPVPVDVFCVEHGRWRDTASRRQPGVANEGASFGSANNVMAAPKVRAKAQAEKSQSAVWDEVASQVSKNRVTTSTGNLNSVFADKKVNAKLEDYEKAVAPKLATGNVIGAVAAVNGKIISADVFASPLLFKAYRAKLCRSYALEAVSANGQQKGKANADDAKAFLSRDEGAEKTTEKEGVYRLSEKQSSADASFTLEHTTKDRKLIHYSKVKKN